MIALIFCLKIVYAEDYFGHALTNPFNFNKISGFSFDSQHSSKDYFKVGMANPAAIYCSKLGYNYNVIDTDNGQDGICTFPDGSKCEEWQFLGGLCAQNYSYCALNGYDIMTKNVSNTSSIYAVCVNKTTREEVGSVTDLFNLIEKSIMSKENLTLTEPNISTESILTSLAPPLPSDFDWRNNNGNWMTAVKDQGICGSCWSFSTVGTVEAYYNIFSNTHTNLDLSEEYMVSDCLRSNDCCGGFPSSAHDFFRDEGVPDENCLLYNDINCGCDLSCGDVGACTFRDFYSCSNSICNNKCANWQSRIVKTDHSSKITGGSIEQIKERIFTNGPVTALMGFGNTFPDNNVYICGDNDVLLSHAVILLGWNDTGQYWIVKNSWGSAWNGDGYFRIAYGDCGIEKEITYDHGFNIVNSGSDVQEFYSQNAPSDSYLISCISQSAIWRGQSNFGEDAIEEVTFDGNRCKIVGDDNEGGQEQRRYAGSVSIPTTWVSSSPVINWSSWEFRNKTGYCDGPDCTDETFYSPTCPSGYSPVSCLSETAYNIDQGKYGEDDIINMNITNGQCQVVAYDSVVGDAEYYRRTGVVCLPKTPVIVWGDWSLRNDDSGYHDGPGDHDGDSDDANTEEFYSPTCPPETFPVSCLSESATAESERYYGEDDIIDIRILGGRCIVTANDQSDHISSHEQKRRVAAVCIDPTIAGDINKDGNVNIFDIAIIAVAYGSTPQNSTWNPIADINEDKIIDIFDLVFVAVNFGKGS